MPKTTKRQKKEDRECRPLGTGATLDDEKRAKISDVKVTTLDGKKINVLIQGKEYIYQYTVSSDKFILV